MIRMIKVDKSEVRGMLGAAIVGFTFCCLALLHFWSRSRFPCGSAAGFAHVADGHLQNAGVGGLKAGKDDCVGHFAWLHHVGVADTLFGAALPYGELSFNAAGTDASDFDAVLAELSVKGLGEAYLGELGGAIDGFACITLQACHGRDEEEGTAFLGDHGWHGVAGEEEAALHVGVHECVVLFC